MGLYKITNITNLLGKREYKYNSTLDIDYVDGLIKKTLKVKAKESINLDIDSLPLSVHKLRVKNYIIVNEIEREKNVNKVEKEKNVNKTKIDKDGNIRVGSSSILNITTGTGMATSHGRKKSTKKTSTSKKKSNKNIDEESHLRV